MAGALILLGCSAPDPKPANEPFVRFVSPEGGSTLTGGVEFAVEHRLPADLSGVEFGAVEAPGTIKGAPNTVALNTLGLEDGPHTFVYRINDRAGRSWEDFVDVVVDNPDQRLLEYTTDLPSYENGDLITVDLSYTDDNLELSADFSALDDAFDASRVAQEVIGDGQYRLRYQVSAANATADGKHDVLVSSTSAQGESLESPIGIRLRNEPRIPLVVEGAAFVDKPTPALDLVKSEAPEIVEVTSNPTLVTGGELEVNLKWANGNTPAERLFVRAEGHSGYFVMPLPSDSEEKIIALSLPSMKPGITSQPLNLMLIVTDALGKAIKWIIQPITAMNVGSGGVQVSLTWDKPVDLDLHITDPQGNLINFRQPNADGGTLDLDSNPNCNIDNKNAENVFWPSGSELPGQYTARVNMFSACSQQDVNYKVTVRLCGNTETFEGTFKASDASEDGAGREIKKFTLNCLQRAHGTVSYQDRSTSFNGPTGFAVTTTTEPARFVPVTIVRSSDNACLARGLTDVDGKYDLRFANSGSPTYTVQTEARWGNLTPAASTGDCPGFDAQAEVVGRTGNTVYSFNSAAIDGSVTADRTEDIVVPLAQNSGAFNIISTIGAGINWVAGTTVSLPRLTARWASGPGGPSTSQFLPGANTLEIMGEPTDPDEFDDMVIAHEFMHFVADIAPIPGPGGPHNGQVAPDLAFSEGMATGLALDALSSDIYFDTFVSNGADMCGNCFNLELGTSLLNNSVQAVFIGTVGGTMTGDVSEFLTSMVLKDLFDGTNAPLDGTDQIDRSRTPTLAGLFLHLPNTSRVNRGAPGIDLVDFLDGWRCSDQLLTSLAVQNNHDAELRKILDHRQFPYDFPTPPTCF